MSNVTFDVRPSLSTVPADPHGNAESFRQSLEAGDWAILSAERSELTPRENKARSAQLWADLVSYGFLPIPAEGIYDGTREASYVVFGIPERLALTMGQKYGQESILIPAGLRYCATHTLYPSKGFRWECDGTNCTRVVLDSGDVVEFSAEIDFN